MFWIILSAMATMAAIGLARRVDGGESLWVKQALYFSAIGFIGFGSYSVYQWDAARSAPEQIQAHLPLYPAANLKSRVPAEHIARVERLFGGVATAEGVQGQWVFETSDSTMDVGRYYQNWVRRWRMPAEIDLGTDYTSVMVSKSDYVMSVTARDHWGRTRITYTLMNPLS